SLDEFSEAGAGVGKSPGRQFNMEIVERLPYNFDRFVVHRKISIRMDQCCSAFDTSWFRVRWTAPANSQTFVPPISRLNSRSHRRTRSDCAPELPSEQRNYQWWWFPQNQEQARARCS